MVLHKLKTVWFMTVVVEAFWLLVKGHRHRLEDVEVYKNHQAGLEAREGGKLVAMGK